MILLRGDLQPPSAHIFPAQGALAKLGSRRGGKRALLGSYHLPFTSPGMVSLEENISCMQHETALQLSGPWRKWAAPSSLRSESFPKPASGGSGQPVPLLPCRVAGGTLAAAGEVGKCKTHLGSCRKLFVPPKNSRFE